MEVNYSVIDPTGNITVLVLSQIPEAEQPEIASKILVVEETAEQVGFLTKGLEDSDITLRMAGGEFCGNATMSTAALYCEKKGLSEAIVKVKVIGTKEPVAVTCKKEGIYYACTLKMPKPYNIKEELFSFETHNYRYPVVNFPGISHVIIEDNMSIYMAERAIKLWCDKLKVKGMGFMLLSEDKKILRPLVYITHPETLYWESSCASGTTAVGAYFSDLKKAPVSMDLKEPGGVLNVSTDADGNLFLSGKVTVSVIDKKETLR